MCRLAVLLVLVQGAWGVSPVDSNADDDPRVFCGEDPDAFFCDVTQCVPRSDVCNGVSECHNGHDESVRVCGCGVAEFQCNQTFCVDILKRCDRVDDCENGRDELECATYMCPVSRVKCANHFCILRDLQCDHKDDCGDNSDEAACDYRECYPTEWRCNNSACIPSAFLCDGSSDCFDQSDEINCDSHVRCDNGLYVGDSHRCDGWVECIDSQNDELNCGYCDNTTHTWCANGRCIRQANRCDGVCDCLPQCDDEKNCGLVPCLEPGRFMCLSGSRCLRPQYVCDGHNDCWNNMIGHDEEFCGGTEEECAGGLWCTEGKCLRQHGVCDQVIDCLDGSDEADCKTECEKAEFRCADGMCIPAAALCDTVKDCRDLSDETNCAYYKCSEHMIKCATSGQCVRQEQLCDFRMDCLDGSDEAQCDIPEKCGRGFFRCRSGQCIPEPDVCISGMREGDGAHIGCVDNSHLLDCRNRTCLDGYFKCKNSYCVNATFVCDKKIDCATTFTDEENCSFPCPYQDEYCECRDVEMNCEDRQLPFLPDVSKERGLQKFRLKGNFLNETLNEFTFHDIPRLSYLDLSYNHIDEIRGGYFLTLWRLTTLNLAGNDITMLHNGTFIGLESLTSIHLKNNDLMNVQPYAFLGLTALRTLDLSWQSIEFLMKDSFVGLRNLRSLNVSSNLITSIEDGAFNGLPKLQTLDISRNFLRVIEDNVFNGLPALNRLLTDEFRWCCLARDVPRCLPLPDEFSSCQDLMSNYVLRVSVWVLGSMSLLGNMVVIAWRIRDTRDGKVHSFLITNLAIGDLLMGAYLIIIASVDFRYRGVYSVYDGFWRQSPLCKFAGFLSTYSSELSVLTLTVITIDRFISIIFPFRIKRLGMREARVVMVLLWAMVFALAAVPLMNIQYFHNFYGRSGVCLALHITPEKPSGWEYSVFVFLALNFVSFVLIFLSYMWMFLVARKTRAAARSPQMKTDRAMARRMTLIVLTDFCCWIPIIILGVASLSGSQVPPQVFAWIAVFVLPLNSAINPLLYTLSTASFLAPARRRAFKFRQSFISSLAHTADSKTTGLSTADDHCSPSTELVGCRRNSRKSPKYSNDHMCMRPLNHAECRRAGVRGHDRRLLRDSTSTAEYTRSDTIGYDSDLN